jgi:hypothetical protein
MPRDISTIPFATRREALRFAALNERAQRLSGELPAAVSAPGGTTAAGTLPGAPAFGYAGAYGGIPQVASPGATQGAAIGANVGALPGLFDLSGQVNTFNAAQAVAPFRANLPGYDSMVAQASQNIGNNLAGQIAPDVWRNLQQMAAERGTAIGAPGSPNAEAGLLRALGLTTLDLQNLGQTQLTGAIARTPTGPQFNPAAMFVSPEDWQAAQQAANLYAAAPVPELRAKAEMNALRSGVGAGAQTTAPSALQLPVASTSQRRLPSLPSLPMATPRPAPAAPGRGWGETWSMDPSTGQMGGYASTGNVPGAGYSAPLGAAASSPYSLGLDYNLNTPSGDSSAAIPPEVSAIAQGDFGMPSYMLPPIGGAPGVPMWFGDTFED